MSDQAYENPEDDPDVQEAAKIEPPPENAVIPGADDHDLSPVPEDDDSELDDPEEEDDPDEKLENDVIEADNDEEGEG